MDENDDICNPYDPDDGWGIEVDPTSDGLGFVATCPSEPFARAFGVTEEEAYQNLLDELEDEEENDE